MKRYIHASYIVDKSYLMKQFKKDVPLTVRKQAAEIWKSYIDAEEYDSNPGLKELKSVIDAIDNQLDFATVMYALGYYDEEDYQECMDSNEDSTDIETDYADNFQEVVDFLGIQPDRRERHLILMYHLVPKGLTIEEQTQICVDTYHDLQREFNLPNLTLFLKTNLPSGSYICWGETRPGGIIYGE